MPNVFIKTYGCQMNVRDSEAVAAQLLAKGYRLVSSEHNADIILLNTCSVRDQADQKALGKMAHLAAISRAKGRGTRLGFMGCMAQIRGQSLMDALPDVDLVLGTQKFHRVGEYLDQILSGERNHICDVDAEAGSESTIVEHLPKNPNPNPNPNSKNPNPDSHSKNLNPNPNLKNMNSNSNPDSNLNLKNLNVNSHPNVNPDSKNLISYSYSKNPNPFPVSAFVSIMQGCNQHCSFCIVPFTRGRERSRSIAEIVEECGQLVSNGTKEVTLLGQIVTSFGKREIANHKGKSAFVQLLEALHSIRGLERIRFTSPHPKGYGEDLIEAYRDLPKLCASAHLPVQSGSNRILRQMRRGYTRERFLEIIDKLRKVNPQIGITTDIIVAFPGETKNDFGQTLDLVREAQFDNAFVFKYSPRQGTPAASLPNPISKSLTESRHETLLKSIGEIAAIRYEKFVGKRVRVLVEGQSRRNPHRLQGRTSCNKIVVFEGTPRHIGELLNLQIERVGSFTLYGNPHLNS